MLISDIVEYPAQIDHATKPECEHHRNEKKALSYVVFDTLGCRTTRGHMGVEGLPVGDKRHFPYLWKMQ